VNGTGTRSSNNNRQEESMSTTTQTLSQTAPGRVGQDPRRAVQSLLALALIGLVALAAVLWGSDATPQAANGRATVQLQAPAAPVVPHGYVRDPYTHALLRVPVVHPARASNATATPPIVHPWLAAR
jgi:hypothetical protein